MHFESVAVSSMARAIAERRTTLIGQALFRSQEHKFWVLDEFFEFLTPHGSYSAIDDAVI